MESPLVGPSWSSLGCSRCAEVLKEGTHWDCAGCCRILHATCCNLPGHVVFHMKMLKKPWKSCRVCKSWIREEEKGKVNEESSLGRKWSSVDRLDCVDVLVTKRDSREEQEYKDVGIRKQTRFGEIVDNCNADNESSGTKNGLKFELTRSYFENSVVLRKHNSYSCENIFLEQFFGVHKCSSESSHSVGQRSPNINNIISVFVQYSGGASKPSSYCDILDSQPLLSEEIINGDGWISEDDTDDSAFYEPGEETCAESAMVAQLQPSPSSDWMDPVDAARQQRIARYKEERRRQLAAQYGRPQDTASGSSSGGGTNVTIRSTRASRLRSAAASTNTNEGTKGAGTPRAVNGDRKDLNGRLGSETPKEVSEHSPSPGTRDKSSKRKSNLNRSLNAEPVPPPISITANEDGARRRRSVASPVVSQSPKTSRPTSTHAPDSDSPRSASARVNKRVTPPRETTARPRPRSSSGLLERQNSASQVEPTATPPAVNGFCSIPTEEPSTLPDVVVLPSSRPSSILKKKSVDETPLPSSTIAGKPVSILKRKTSQEEATSSAAVQPVTFSPSVVEPGTNNSRRQGILKKHRSLDDGRRSVSPPSSLRRSSLEELRRRTNSPEPQSILKRKTSREEGIESPGFSEPQGILKRKISSGSSGPVHVTIAESVILAVAGEDSLCDEAVKPILKKKSSICEEPQDVAAQWSDTPRPILKKKSSSETDDGEEKPKKPILKSRRDSGTRVSESRSSFTDHETMESCTDDQSSLQNGREERNIPSALSARAESSSPERLGVIWRKKNNDPDFLLKRRSFDSCIQFKEEKRESPRSRASFSVAERVINMENFLALETQEMQRPRSFSPGDLAEDKGALPKRGRDRDRWRTQPITVQELSSSRNWSPEAAAEEMAQGHALTRSNSVSARASLFEAQLKQKEEEAQPKRVLKGSAGRRVKLDPTRFQTQPVTQDEVEEARKVNDATKSSTDDGDDEDPSKLSLAERVRLFNTKMVSERMAPRPRQDRHKTQPVTPLEVQTAQKLTPISRSASSVLVSGILKNLTEKNEGPQSKIKSKISSESEEEIISEPSSPLKRGILKSQSWRAPKSDSAGDSESSNLRSVLKKDNKKPVSPDRRISKDLHSILKVSKEKESSSSEETETESEDDKPNANSDLINLLHKVEAQARGERKPQTPDCNKTAQITSNNKKPEESDKLMNLKNLDQGKENYNVSRRFRRKKVDGSELSEGDSSSSGGREVRKIIGNDAVARRRQAGLNREVAERGKRSSEGSALSKSRSHSAMNGGGEVMLRPPEVAEAAPLRRCRTQPMDECDEPKANGVSIAQRLEALQKRGHTDWKKRISRLNPEEELPPTISINAAAQVLQERLAAPARPNGEPSPAHSPNHTPLDQRLELLETSTQDWRKRVSPSDANQFSVAGRMPTVTPSPLHSPALERRKKIPKPERFRSKGTPAAKDTKSVPTSPEADSTPGAFKRSISAPSGDDDNSLSSGDGDVINGPLVSVPKAFDDDFSSFFASKTSDERIELRDEDLEEVINSTSQLLVQRRTVKVQRRRGASTNPVKALAARTDLRSEYVEVRTGVAQREEKRLRVEKLAKNSSLAVEALAGLASQEDFAAVTLRSTADSTAHLSPMLPYKELMLLHIKGRRHVQTRLVCPHYSSVNQGDSYVLVTPSQVFHWVGEFSNVIERSRGAEIAQHIARTRDLGCTAGNVTALQGNLPQPQFWRLLGADETIAASFTGVEAGHPDEDELYELALTDTNMIYEVDGEELVPRKDCWGTIPKIEILHHNKVLVFDFGAELYVWMGKTVPLDRRRTALRLGQELWAQGYDYSECDVCPLTQAEYLGSRPGVESVEKKGEERPDWALLAKVTQHMETVLLREKFLDWPDFSRVIQVKSSHKDKQGEGSFEVKPCDAQAMVDWTPPPPDLVLEGSHLGRGTKYFDPESHKHYEVSTLSVTMWHVQQYDSCELDAASLGQLHSGDTYVVRWCYSVTVTGRELTGQPSRHAVVGRDRCAYFTWQGADASTNDKGAAALLTVQLDQERGPQLRLTQGQEPPAFRQLFGGGLIIHKGRRCDTNHRRDGWRLYMISGEEKEEVTLVEVSCSMRQLRSRACLLLLYPHDGQGYLWRGTHTLPHAHQVATTAVERLKEILPSEAGLEGVKELQIHDINEGKEPKIFFEALGGHSRQLYMTSTQPGDYTTRLFHLTSASGVFQATPIVPACHHPSRPTPFPYSQHHLYSVRQPALFLVDGGSSLWLWQGWWGEEGRWEDEGVGEGRWQAERRAAMTTALEYHRLCSTGRKSSPLLVWAGLEPLDFTNLFPSWTDRDDIAELNIRDGRKPGEVLPVEEELERLTRSTYPPAQLLQRPLPQGIDPTRLEEYLAPHHFQEVLGLSKEDFTELPAWKQNKLKQEKGLF